MAAKAKKPPPSNVGGFTAFLLLLVTAAISVLFINMYHPHNDEPSYPYQPAPTWCQEPAQCSSYGPPPALPSPYVPVVTRITG